MPGILARLLSVSPRKNAASTARTLCFTWALLRKHLLGTALGRTRSDQFSSADFELKSLLQLEPIAQTAVAGACLPIAAS